MEGGSCDYEAAAGLKRALFEKAFERSGLIPGEEYRRFRGDNAFWLEDYALFSSLKRSLGLPWYHWPAPLRDRDRGALEEAKRSLADEVKREVFLQFLFFRQWERLHGLCRERGVRVIGDVPVYVSHDSADLWAHREIFDLDASGCPSRVAGVPRLLRRRGSGGATLSTAGTSWNGKVSTGGSKGSVTGWPCSTWSE